MKQALKHIEPATVEFLRSRFHRLRELERANAEMQLLSGIHSFFPTQQDFLLFLDFLKPKQMVTETIARREYGDYQTPSMLSDIVCWFLHSQEVSPTALVEPTFGKGAFIVSALRSFPTLKQVHAVEIYEPYCWHTKFAILELFIKEPALSHPSIYLYCDDVFKFAFSKLVENFIDDRLLVLGNPPWVTNSELSSLNSTNVPTKSNFKSFNGLDAITGKGNFDIGEYIILSMLNAFANRNGSLAMLAKNSVIKNVLQDLPKTNYSISNLFSLKFDAKLYFNASVEASLFRCDFAQKENKLTCKVASLESPQVIESEFGWANEKFVSDVSLYQEVQSFDGSSPFVWRQGVKHDCSKILELDLIEGKYKNGFNKFIDIEDDLIFPLVKSSDIQNGLILTHRKFVIITQKKVGDDTSYIAERFPHLNQYLLDNLHFFSERKSSIYSGRSPFAIFGIGDYSFKPYKVAISGLYKKPKFSLIQPANGKPVMLDDTCYFLGFDDQTQAAFVLLLLNSEPVQKLLRSLAFLDAKRPYTKDILMRVDLFKVAEFIGFEKISQLSTQLPENVSQLINRNKWNEFLISGVRITKTKPQPSLFDEPSTIPANTVSHVV
ncbi:MAG: hypothetical protein QME52_09665 [Bacteroidota bacterium]|nr:hypothetical protein [Bacteroidota bacterium]